MNAVYLSLGSNIEPEKNIASAVQSLRDEFGALTVSPVYQSPSVGFDGDDFLNLVVSFSAGSPPATIQSTLRGIEDLHGRHRNGERFAPRTLDIDLLLYGEDVVNTPELRVPRDEIVEYAFVLAPLADIARELVHPQLGVSVGELWSEMRSKEPHQSTMIRAVDLVL